MTPTLRRQLKVFIVMGALLEAGYLVRAYQQPQQQADAPPRSAPASPTPGLPGPGEPRAQWPAELPLGEVKVAASLRRSVDLNNTGQGLLQVEAVESDCQCLQAQCPRATLKPGQSLRFSLVYRAPAETGRFTKRLWLRSNDPRGPVSLTVSGIVVGSYVLDPVAVNFGRLQSGQRVERQVTLTSSNGAFHPHLRPPPAGPIQPQRESQDPDGTYRLVLSAQPRSARDCLSTSLVIETGNSQEPLVVLPTLGEVVLP